jgi:hypothetical protein
MEKKKLLRLSLAMFLVLLIVYFVTQLFSSPSPAEGVEAFPIQVAKRAAEANLSSFEDWRGPTLEEWYTFYDLERQPTAYIFNVSDYYGKAGYITISATTRMEPVIEISNSADTPVTNILKLTNDIIIGTIYEPSDVKAEHIYLGGTEYYVKLTLREGNNIKEKYYEIKGTQISEVNLEHVLNKQELFSTYKEENSEEKWGEFLDNP